MKNIFRNHERFLKMSEELIYMRRAELPVIPMEMNINDLKCALQDNRVKDLLEWYMEHTDFLWKQLRETESKLYEVIKELQITDQNLQLVYNINTALQKEMGEKGKQIVQNMYKSSCNNKYFQDSQYIDDGMNTQEFKENEMVRLYLSEDNGLKSQEQIEKIIKCAQEVAPQISERLLSISFDELGTYQKVLKTNIDKLKEEKREGIETKFVELDCLLGELALIEFIQSSKNTKERKLEDICRIIIEKLSKYSARTLYSNIYTLCDICNDSKQTRSRISLTKCMIKLLRNACKVEYISPPTTSHTRNP